MFQFPPISSNLAQPFKKIGTTFHRPQSTNWSTLWKSIDGVLSDGLRLLWYMCGNGRIPFKLINYDWWCWLSLLTVTNKVVHGSRSGNSVFSVNVGVHGSAMDAIKPSETLSRDGNVENRGFCLPLELQRNWMNIKLLSILL
jgi:hypothetical protein